MPPFCYADDGYCDRGYNNTTSELGHMFYNNLGYLGLKDANGNQRESGYGVQNNDNNGASVSVENLQSSAYWLADEHSLNIAWAFATDNGYQGIRYGNTSGYSWAVRTGDVNLHPMPVPEAAWLFGMGLISLVGMKRGYR